MTKAGQYSTTEKLSDDAEKNINISYMTRRFTEIVENPFLARTLADSCLQAVEEKIGRKNLQEHFSFVVSLIVKYLTEEKAMREEQVFLDYIENKKLLLAVSDDETIGYRVPETDTITVSRLPNTFQYYLFEDVELETMNNLEKKVGQILDNQAKILWWFRNKASKDWYAIQGWKEYKIRPDFVAAKKRGKNGFETLYIIESKGEHLSGNPDTQYKKSILELMTEQRREKKIRAYQMKLPFEVINEEAEFYLIEEGKEDETLRNLMR